jgi:hypothetical protein
VLNPNRPQLSFTLMLNSPDPSTFYNQVFFNSCAVFDADGTDLGVYRKSHIPDGPGYTEKFYFSPGACRVPPYWQPWPVHAEPHALRGIGGAERVGRRHRLQGVRHALRPNGSGHLLVSRALVGSGSAL